MGLLFLGRFPLMKFLEFIPEFELQSPRLEPVSMSTLEDRFSFNRRISRCPNSPSFSLFETLISIVSVISSKCLSDKLDVSPVWWSLRSVS